MQNFLGSIALVLASIAIGLVLGEVSLRFLAPAPEQVVSGTYYTPKARVYGWAFPPHTPLASHDPDTGQVTAIFKTNAEGWNDVEHSRTKPPGTYRIVVIGDSYTFGVVSLEQLYTRRLEDIVHERGYDRVEVISMGNPGWGLDHALVVFEHEGASYQPNLVIYQNCENDYFPLLHGMFDVTAENFDSKTFLWPFRFSLDDTGDLIKEDLTPFFDKAVAQKKSQRTFLKALADWMHSSSVGYYLSRSFERLQNWWLGQHGRVQHVTMLLKPTFGNVGDVTPVRDVADENLVEYRKNYQSQVNGQLELVRQIAAQQTDQRLAFILPANEDPFVYRKGSLRETEVKAWRLMEALLVRFRDSVAKAGAQFVVFSEDGEEGKRAYFRRVGNVVNVDGQDYAVQGDRLEEFDWSRGRLELDGIASRRGFPLIPLRRTYPRYIYDNHSNVEGNENMALDIADFLVGWEAFQNGYRDAK